tara:strand:+ start:60720 stop:61394 length:675 start_codon:yes stop_codon:yes gene_type:complete
MSIWNLKNLISIAAGVSASAAAVRQVLGREVDRRTDKAIADAAQQARQRIREQAHLFFSDGFIRFFWTTLGKASIILTIASLFLMGWVADHWSAAALALMFVVFTSYDAWRIFPSAKFLFGELRKFGWRPKLILAETVSAQVFEQVLEEARQLEVKQSENILLLLAGRKRDDLTEKLARAVADIAAETSWKDIKPMVFGFVVRCGILFFLYSSLVWTLVWMIRH